MKDFVSILHEALGIPPQYCSLSGINGVVECFLNARWIRYVVHENHFTSPPLHGELLPEEVKAALELGRTLGSQWNKFLIQVIPKCFEDVHPLPKLATTQNSKKLSYSRLLHHVCMVNAKNLWKNSYQRYPDHSVALQWKEKGRLATHTYNGVFREIVTRLYNCRLINIGNIDSPQICSDDDTGWEENVNILQAVCVFESRKYFFIIFESSHFSVRNCIDFSPAKLTKNELGPLYILFQLLQATSAIQDKGLFLGNVTLHNLRINDSFHLSVVPEVIDSIFKIDDSNPEDGYAAEPLNKRSAAYLNLMSSQQAKDVLNHAGLCTGECSCTSGIAELTELWALHKLSNLDYLLCLSYFAGRSFDSPIFHPTLPWVTDFNSPNAGWRDLTRSKYRLNKGDQQLEQTYELAGSAQDQQISHHIPELFDEITYYIYKARITPKRLLQKYVRNQFVPSHYPSSMGRMFAWTPAECIPEFYLSPELFKSIHCDLPDLQVPPWCNSIEQFLQYHRDALESNYVSRRLHHWIDLTYGYKLSGNASVKSKNVCLSLVDGHEEMSKGGVVQLFCIPHPSKLTPSPYLTISPPMPVQWTDNGCVIPSCNIEEKYEANRGSSLSKRPKNPDFNAEKQSIYLPPNYNPLSALQQVESLHGFLFRQTGNGLQKRLQNHSNSSGVKRLSHRRRIRDMQTIGCLIVELFAPQKCRVVHCDSSLEIRYPNAARVVRHEINSIPRALHRCVRLIFDQETLPNSVDPTTEEGLPPVSCHQLLQPLINIIVFPTQFDDVAKFSAKMYQYSNLLRESRYITDCYSGDKFARKVVELQVKTVARDFSDLADTLTIESLQLIFPYLLHLLRCADSSVDAAWYLTEPTARILGPAKSVTLLLPLLVKLFEDDVVCHKSLKLFHRQFLLQLIVRFGLGNFVRNFVVYLVEGAGGYKQCLQDSLHKGDQKSCTSHKKLRDVDEPETAKLSGASDDLEAQTSPICDGSFRPSAAKSPSDRNDITDVETDLDTFFTFDEGTLEEMQDQSGMELSENFRSPAGSETSLDEVSFHESNTLFDSPCPSPHSASVSIGEETDDVTSPLTSGSIPIPTNKSKASSPGMYSTSLPTRPQTISLPAPLSKPERSPSAELSEQDKCQDSIAEVCCESIMWLAQRLGPVLTARYLTRNLLRMLTLCYLPEYGALAPLTFSPGDSLSVTRKRVVGDRNSSKIILCLLEIAGLYGEQMIQLQYLAHITELISSCEGKLNSGQEAGLIGAMVLFQEILLQLSDPTFVEHLQGTLIRSAVYPVIRLLSSVKVSFPSGGSARRILAWRVIDSVFLMSLRIGREMSIKKLTPAFTRLLTAFDKVTITQNTSRCYDTEGSVDRDRSTTKERAILELKEVFTPELAYYSYVPLCRFLGTKYMEDILSNHDLLRSLCLQYDENHQADHASFLTFNGLNMSEAEGKVGNVEINVAVSGNRIDIKDHQQISPEIDTPSVGFPQNFDISKYVGTKMEDSQRHLRGNWLAYWEHEIGRSERDNSFYFKQIRLQNFVGHCSVVKSLCVLDNENSFISSSKDRTVKLWSLRNVGDGSSQCHAQWTYANHKKSVFDVTFCESQRLAASCDSTVHIWDPFIGKCLKQLDSLKHSPVTVLAALPAPSTQLVTATADATLKFIDLRTFSYAHELKIAASSVGLIRCVAVSADCRLVGVAHSSGVVSSLDLRTGQLLSTWKLHEGDVRVLQWYEKNTFISAAVDQSICVWNTFDSKAKFYMKGPTEPVQFMRVFGSELITGTTGNKIGVHTEVSTKAGFSSTKLRTEAFKGSLTAIQVLPLNRQLMLGSDGGIISLLC